MSRLAILVAALIGLASCDAGSGTGKDGYYFEKPEYEQTEVRVRLATTESQRELEQRAAERGVKLPKGDLGAFALLSVDGKSCTIYLIKPIERYQPEWLGHEVTHCFYGRWHPTQGHNPS